MVYPRKDQLFQALLEDVLCCSVPVIREPRALAGLHLGTAAEDGPALLELFMALVWHWTLCSEDGRGRPLQISTARLLEGLKWGTGGLALPGDWSTHGYRVMAYCPGSAYEKLDRAMVGLLRSRPAALGGQPVVEKLERGRDGRDWVTCQFAPGFVALMTDPDAMAIDHARILKKVPAGTSRVLARLLLFLRAQQQAAHGRRVWIGGRDLLRRLGHSTSNAAPSRIKKRLLPDNTLRELEAAGILSGGYETRSAPGGATEFGFEVLGAFEGTAPFPGWLARVAVSFGVNSGTAMDIATDNGDHLLRALGLVVTGRVLPSHSGGENPGGTIVGLMKKWHTWPAARGQTWGDHHVEGRSARSSHRYFKSLYYDRIEWAKRRGKSRRSLAARVLLDPKAPYDAWALAHLMVHDEMGAIGYPAWVSGVARGMRDSVRARAV